MRARVTIFDRSRPTTGRLRERVREANEDADDEERVGLNHLIEVQLAGCVTIADVARLERDVPGMSVAVSRWLAEMDE